MNMYIALLWQLLYDCITNTCKSHKKKFIPDAIFSISSTLSPHCFFQLYFSLQCFRSKSASLSCTVLAMSLTFLIALDHSLTSSDSTMDDKPLITCVKAPPSTDAPCTYTKIERPDYRLFILLAQLFPKWSV